MVERNEVPSVDMTVRVVLYLACVIALGMSWSWTLELMNTAFEVGVLGCLGNLLLSVLLVRYVVVRHFTKPGLTTKPAQEDKE